MTKLPHSLLISLWSVGTCWIAVTIAYLTDSDTGLLVRLLVGLMAPLAVPMVLIGALIGSAERSPEKQNQ